VLLNDENRMILCLFILTPACDGRTDRRRSAPPVVKTCCACYAARQKGLSSYTLVPQNNEQQDREYDFVSIQVPLLSQRGRAMLRICQQLASTVQNVESFIVRRIGYRFITACS